MTKQLVAEAFPSMSVPWRDEERNGQGKGPGQGPRTRLFKPPTKFHMQILENTHVTETSRKPTFYSGVGYTHNNNKQTKDPYVYLEVWYAGNLKPAGCRANCYKTRDVY